MAKAVGAKATKFYVGFPPPLIRKQRGETEYGIGTIPLGGYVRIVGMTRPQSSDLWRVNDAVEEAAPRRDRRRADDRFGTSVGRRCARAWTGRTSTASRRRPDAALAALEEERELLDPQDRRRGSQGPRRAWRRRPTRAPTGGSTCGAASPSSPPARPRTCSRRDRDPDALLRARHAGRRHQLARRVRQLRLARRRRPGCSRRPHRRPSTAPTLQPAEVRPAIQAANGSPLVADGRARRPGGRCSSRRAARSRPRTAGCSASASTPSGSARKHYARSRRVEKAVRTIGGSRGRRSPTLGSVVTSRREPRPAVDAGRHRRPGRRRP